MRRLLPLALAALALVLVGCGTERPAAVREADATFSPVPSPTVSPTTPPPPSATPTPAGSEASDPLAGFPLALDYDEENGDDHSPVVVTSKPGMSAYKNCGETAWDPHEGTTDLIGVKFRGEAEWSRGRTLALYPTAADAAMAVDAARASLAACPEEEVGDGYVAVTTIYDDVRMGEQSVVWADTGGLRQDGEIMFDTGLTVYHLIRVGRAVLASYEYGEGNGGPKTRSPSIGRATAADRPVVDAMGDLPTDDVLTLTPRGAGPFELGMSVEDARAAGGEVRLRGGATTCPELTWTSPSGATVRGAFSPGSGLGYVSVDGGRTAEGITLGATVDDLHAAYPDLQHSDNGLWYADREPGDLTFATYDGGVNWMVAIGDDQHCAG